MFSFAQNSASRITLGLVGTMVGAALCLGAAAGPANAQTNSVDAPRTAKVVHSDLNLAMPAHQKALDARLRAAARKVCANDGLSVRERSAETQCRRDALKAAGPQRIAATLDAIG